MKSIGIIAAATLIATSAFAQQTITADRPTQIQRPSDDEINARIQTLTVQRNTAQDQIVILSGQAQVEIAKRDAEIERLKKEGCKPAEKK